MLGAIIIFAFTALVGFILWFFDKRNRPKQKEEKAQETGEERVEEPSSEECCGLHITCEKDSLVPFSTDVEYYDDEELDALAGRDPETYSEEEVEELRDVLLTLRVEEIAGWARSLQLRNIALPESIRDELLLLVKETREQNAGK